MGDSSQGPNKPLLSDSAYNKLKQSVTLVLPALGALYFALAQIWYLPKSEEVVGSIAAINTFLGVLLGISTRSYHKSDLEYKEYAGVIVSENKGDKQVISLVVDDPDPAKILNLKEATFRVSDTGSNPKVTE